MLYVHQKYVYLWKKSAFSILTLKTCGRGSLLNSWVIKTLNFVLL